MVALVNVYIKPQGSIGDSDARFFLNRPHQGRLRLKWCSRSFTLIVLDTSSIETMIADAVRDFHPETEVHDLLAAVAAVQGKHASEEDLQAGARFVVSYLQQVPYMMKVGWTAALNVGLEEEMRRILESVQSYWTQDDDIIPDHLGLVGLLDDAYCSLTSLQAVSDHYRLQTGKHLFPDDLTAANKAMRRIIGEPYATDLDRLVTQTMHATGLIESMKLLASEEKQIDFANQSTIWNHGPAGKMDVDDLRKLGLIG